MQEQLWEIFPGYVMNTSEHWKTIQYSYYYCKYQDVFLTPYAEHNYSSKEVLAGTILGHLFSSSYGQYNLVKQLWHSAKLYHYFLLLSERKSKNNNYVQLFCEMWWIRQKYGSASPILLRTYIVDTVQAKFLTLECTSVKF